MQLQLMCCTLSNLWSSQFTEGQIKRDKGESLRGQGAKRLKSIFELANTSSNYRLYTCGCGPLLCTAGILVPFSNEMITG